MSIFDLILILGFLASIATLIATAVAFIQGRRATVARILRIYGVGVLSYFAVDFAFAYLGPQRVIAMATPWCFDEWCLTVTRATHSLGVETQTYDVDFELSSQARRKAQRANGAWVYLIDDQGRRYAPEAKSSDVPLNTLLQPSEWIAASRQFRVRANIRHIGLVTGHGGPYCGPMNILIIGSGGCLFQKPAVIRLQ